VKLFVNTRQPYSDITPSSIRDINATHSTCMIWGNMSTGCTFYRI